MPAEADFDGALDAVIFGGDFDPVVLDGLKAISEPRNTGAGDTPEIVGYVHHDAYADSYVYFCLDCVPDDFRVEHREIRAGSDEAEENRCAGCGWEFRDGVAPR